MYQGNISGLEECASHPEILRILHKEVTNVIQNETLDETGKLSHLGEILDNSYMFFISKISHRGSALGINKGLYC